VPSGDGPFPVAVLLHGGYWRAKYGKRLMRLQAADLRRRGVAAWNVEYRRIGRGQGGGWPATFDDVGAAIDLLAAVGDGRLDLERVAAIGHSAGGQLALWAATRAGGRVRIGRVVAQGTPCNLSAVGEPAESLLGGTPESVPDRYAAADPMLFLPIGVPTLLVHGAGDQTVPLFRSREYCAAARAAGDDVELVCDFSGGHRVHLDTRSDAWRVTADWVADGLR
jgi:acetyl esterase/lipase